MELYVFKVLKNIVEYDFFWLLEKVVNYLEFKWISIDGVFGDSVDCVKCIYCEKWIFCVIIFLYEVVCEG